ncbi:MAG: hypothetical protein PVI30_07185 [Myxococcales bacterium]|jgi:hypothetical protein
MARKRKRQKKSGKPRSAPKPPPPPKSRPRPLIARPGARFDCFSDGLCCTDIHALGPMTRSEVKHVRSLIPDAVVYNDEVEGHCMAYAANGGCAQLENGLCGIHAKHGPEHKPGGCRRFPYGLVSTPHGGRVTTEHRCPCRTLGERPELDLEDAERSLLDAAGRLEVDQEAPDEVQLTVEDDVSFERYAELESGLLERLAAGERIEDVLAATAFPELHKSCWQVYAAEFLDMRDGTAGGASMSWFGDALLGLIEGHTPPERPRPWAPSFDKAIARAKQPGDPEQILRDWVADEIWMLRWLEWDCPFDVARAELTTRVAMARWLIERLRPLGLREDRCAAEAVMVVELGACTNQWPEVVDAIANDPSPAQPLG